MKTVAAASGVFRDFCSEEQPYHTAEELSEGLKQGDEGARLFFVFFLRLRKNERTRCSVEKAEARLQHSTIPILSTTQNYRFTSQVYSTFLLWYTCLLILFCPYLCTEAPTGRTAISDGSGTIKLWGYSLL